MADVCNLTKDDVQTFIEDMGGKVTDHQLVKHFRKFLNAPNRQAEVRDHFKKIVNSVATIKVEDCSTSKVNLSDGTYYVVNMGGKYLVVKKNRDICGNNCNSYLPIAATPITIPSSPLSEQDGQVPISRILPPGNWSTDLPPGHTPKPPPRRKSFAKNSKLEETRKQFNKENTKHESLAEEESPALGNVKEKAQKLNDSVLTIPKVESSSVIAKRREQRNDNKNEDDFTVFGPNLSAAKKKWIVTASKSDYHGLVGLLKDEPRLAHFKDFNRYTALHWAAKHGNLDVIKLLAGTHKVDPNLKTGHTSLHLAAMFGREEIMEILINSYGADPTIRDFSGKRPLQYLPKRQAERMVSLFPSLASTIELNAKSLGRCDKDSSFVRIGSLNSKVKKNSVAIAGGKALIRMKSWGSADNIPVRESYLMPPPKFFPKKKKSKKRHDHFEIIEGVRAKSVDSDSDSTSGATS